MVDETLEYSGPGGRLSKLTTAAGNGDLATSASQTWSYDALGLPSSHSHPRAAGAPAFPVTFGYGYGLPTSIAANGQTVVPAAAYGPAAALTSWTAGNSGTPVVTTIAPDASLLPRPASISNALWSSGAYAYDGAGDILKLGTTDAFTYDSRARLTSARFGSTTRAFAYDRWGNLTQNGATGFTLDAATNRITSGGAQYDARGNMTARTGETMSYDLLDRQYRNSTAGADWVYLFAGSGERVAKFPAKATVLRREMARYVAEANGLAKGWTLPACTGPVLRRLLLRPRRPPHPARPRRGHHCRLRHEPASILPRRDAHPRPDGRLSRQGVQARRLFAAAVRGHVPGRLVLGRLRRLRALDRAALPRRRHRRLRHEPPPVLPRQHRRRVGDARLAREGPRRGSPGSLFWSAYHPVPRGTIYTFRDDSNRVVTEMAGGSTGASTATLSVTRDNVFLGNLLVASYVASPAGWQYTASDHLGSPRVVFNQARQIVETHKYWPYGEDTTTTPPTQRLAYCLMERDSESTRFYDHARNHDHGLGRFLSPDRVGGTPANPQSWNRYAYTLNNPMKYVDPDGRLTIVVHGTWAASNPTFTPGGVFYQRVTGSVPDRAYASFTWSGGNTTGARSQAANSLANFIRHYKFAPGEQLNLIAHSHGGNVAIAAVNLGLGRAVDNLVTLGTPARADFDLSNKSSVSSFLAVSDTKDPIQVLGGRWFNSPIWGEWGPAGRSLSGAANILVNTPLTELFKAHEQLHESDLLWRTISRLMNTPETMSTLDRQHYWIHD